MSDGIGKFIARWEASGANERANYQLFLSELCDLLDLPHPDPAGPDTAENAYVFERGVQFSNLDGTHSPGRIDLYKRDCFVLEEQSSPLTATQVAAFFTKAKKTAPILQTLVAVGQARVNDDGAYLIQ